LMSDRAVELVEYVEEIAPDIFLVQSASKPIRYTVGLRGKMCECPDWTYRGSVSGLLCKHLMAAWLSKYRKPVPNEPQLFLARNNTPDNQQL